MILPSEATWVRSLARIEARQLQLLMVVLLALLAALLWLVALRQPLAQLQALRAEHSLLESSAIDPTLGRQTQQLHAEIVLLAQQLGAANLQRSPDRMLVDLIGAIDRAGNRHGVTLNGATPGPSRKTMIFEELPFDIEARGSYQALVGWIADLEQSLPTLAIVRFDLRPVEQPAQLSMKIRVAAYRLQDAP